MSFLFGGVLFKKDMYRLYMFRFSPLLYWLVLVFLILGNFELDLTSYLFYKFITVVSTILLYHMYGRWFILFFFPPL